MKSVLISGGSGFFGQHFARHCLDHGYDRICIYSRNEYNQFRMRQDFNDDERLRWFIGDVRDRDRLRRAMEGVDHVVHAAALKRIEVGFYNPVEMVKTNVVGTMNAIEAAMDACVDRFVLLSSDKAWRPISAYGHSKAMAESIVLAANNMVGQGGTRFDVTRYGNVMGSTGSVLPVWRKMIADGNRVVPVTSPECTRFWMSPAQACALVSEALNAVSANHLHIPMLPAFRLGDLAEALDVHMDIKGLAPHEKLHEGMDEGNTSDMARRMTVEEIQTALKEMA